MINKLLYIGQCENGSTSRMRFEKLQLYFNCPIELINISMIIQHTPKLQRSLGWRFKIGSMISEINNLILINTKNKNYEITWIDKGVFIQPQILKHIRSKTKVLVHFTPDPAFFYHQSRFFRKSIKYYDHCITTKSFEIGSYKRSGAQNCIYLTQGFDKQIHTPMVDFEEKKYDVCFIGHYEKERAELIQLLLDNDIEVVLAGIKWDSFVKKNLRTRLKYFGTHIAGNEYARLISESRLGLGLLSKWIPEKHTTRTFEIPACKTCLVTESNEEIDAFFSDDDCIKFQNKKDFINQIITLLNNPIEIKQISERGYKRVLQDRRDYESQIFDLCNKIENHT